MFQAPLTWLLSLQEVKEARKQAEEQKGHKTNLEPHFSLHPAYILSICTAFSIS